MDIMDKHGDSLEFCLIERGLRLRDVGSVEFTWHDLAVIVKTLGNGWGNELAVALHGERARWSVQDHMFTRIMNTVQWLAWTKSKGAQKNGKPPEPVYLPGCEPENDSDKHYGVAASTEEVIEFLGDDARELFGL